MSLSENAVKIVLHAVDSSKGAFDSIKQNIKGMSGDFDSLKVAAAGLLAGLSAGAFAGWIKGAIDASDSLNDLSERTGIATDKLSAYQYAAKFADLSNEGLQTGLKGLAKNMLEAATSGGESGAVFKALGVQVKDSSGQMRSADGVLEDLVARFSEMEDGPAKSALAMKVFGKAGEEMLPFLNQGTEGLAEMRAEAESLGLVVSQDVATQAGAFNDQLDRVSMAGSGLATKISAAMLPTLSMLADEFVDNAKGMDVAAASADVVSTALRLLVSGGVIVKSVFQQLGTVLGGFAAAVKFAMDGDFAAAGETLKSSFSDARQNVVADVEQIERIWTKSAGSVKELAKEATKGKAPIEALTKAQKAGGDANAKAENEYKKLITSIREKTATQQAELTSEAKLTDMQKFALKVMTDLRDGRLKLTEEQRIGLATELEAMLQAERAADARVAETAALKSYEATWSEYLGGIEKEIAKRDEEIATLGLSATAIARRNLLLAEERLELAKTGGVADDYLQKLQHEVELRKGLLDKTEILEARQALADNAKETAETWKKTSEEISGSITDALMRGFENGKGFLENLVDTAKSLFKTMVLRPVIQAVVSPMAQGATNMVGSLGSSLFSSITGGSLTAAGGLSGLGSAFASGMGMSPSSAAIIANSGVAGATGMQGFALQAGAYAPPVLAAIASAYIQDQMLQRGWGGDNNREGYARTFASGGLNIVQDRLFGHGATNADASGISGRFTVGGLEDGQRWQDFSQKGGAFRDDKRWTDYSAIDADTGKLISSQIVGLGNAARAVARVMGENITDGIASWKHDFVLQLSENGDLSKASEKIAAEVDRAANSLATHLFPSLSQLAREGETTGQTLLRLGATFDVTNAAALMLGRNWQDAFGAIGVASAAARQQLVDMSGGVEALQGKLGNYYESYFSQTERNQRSLEMLDAQFAAMGVRIDLSKDAFKAYLEDSSKVDLATERGRKLYAGLLDLSDPFGKLVDAMGDGAVGKQVGSLASLLGEKSPIAENVKQAAADWWSKYGTAVEKQADQAAQIKAGLDNMATSLEMVRAVIKEASDSQIAQAGAAYTAMVDELRQVKAKLAAIEANGGLVGAA